MNPQFSINKNVQFSLPAFFSKLLCESILLTWADLRLAAKKSSQCQHLSHQRSLLCFKARVSITTRQSYILSIVRKPRAFLKAWQLNMMEPGYTTGLLIRRRASLSSWAVKTDHLCARPAPPDAVGLMGLRSHWVLVSIDNGALAPVTQTPAQGE